MLIHTNQPLITSFYIKKVLIFCRISDESVLIRNFLRNERVWGKPIGRVRVKDIIPENLFFKSQKTITQRKPRIKFYRKKESGDLTIQFHQNQFCALKVFFWV